MSRVIDLRSDTVTLPSREMLATIQTAEFGDSGRWNNERRGEDPTVTALENLGASLMGKEAALFCNSGTMGNMVALLSHCKPGDKVLVDQRQHIYRTEKGAFAVWLGRLEVVFYDADSHEYPDADSIENILNSQDIKLVCVENTNNNRGGLCTPLSVLEKIYKIAHRHNVPVHMDGARIFNAALSLNVSASDIAQYADTCMFCVSKGLGAPVGSLVCGTNEMAYKMRETRRRLGGDMRQAGVLAAPAIYALEHNIGRLAVDHERAAKVALGIQGLKNIRCPKKVDSNIIMLTAADNRADDLKKKLSAHNIKSGAVDDARVRLVFHLDILDEDVDYVIDALKVIDKEME